MSFNITLTALRPIEIYTRSLRTSYTKMAEFLGVYDALWQPQKLNTTKAVQLIPLLTEALVRFQAHEAKVHALAPYVEAAHNFKEVLTVLLRACKENPDADIGVG
jgi:hypothetical protein